METGRKDSHHWLRGLSRAALVAGVVLSLGAFPGCMCRRSYRSYGPGGVVVTRPVVRAVPVVRTGPAVRVAPVPVQRTAPARRP
jgi:hypothetical protein